MVNQQRGHQAATLDVHDAIRPDGPSPSKRRRVERRAESLSSATQQTRDHPPAPALVDKSSFVVPETQPDTEVPPKLADENRETLETDEQQSKPSQTTTLLNDFLEIKAMLSTELVLHEYDPLVNTPCSCGADRLRLVQCAGCLDFEICCKECWILCHRRMPWHWARVWDGDIFVDSDISTLWESSYVVQLGHHGDPCPSLDSARPIKFTLVHSNGVHGTLISYCNCTGNSKPTQLMRSRVFPGSAKEPETGFTFTVLKQFDIHSLQSKSAAYDYFHSLRRLTDNVHTHLVNDPYQVFMVVVRVWRYLKAHLRFGNRHDLHRFFPHYPKNSCVLRCADCLDPLVNMPAGWQHIPAHLRHLTMIFTTLNGNMHANQFLKNNDPLDFTLFDGNSYFPETRAYADFLKEAKKHKSDEPLPDCNHVKVIQRQQQQGSEGVVSMKVAGIVNHQCDHIYVLASTNILGHENQANVDAAFAHGYRLLRYLRETALDDDRDKLPHKVSYDAMCILTPNINKRHAILEYLNIPPLRHVVRSAKRKVPSAHCRGHIEKCEKLYDPFSHFCNSRSTGETAELYWALLNQLGAQTRQMNDGHRQDTIIGHHNDNNHKKTINFAYLLSEQIMLSRAMFQENRDNFRQLCEIHKDKVVEWSKKNCNPEPQNPNKPTTEWNSPYHRRAANIPSPTALFAAWAEDRKNSTAYVPVITASDTDVEAYWRTAWDAQGSQGKVNTMKAVQKHAATQEGAEKLENERQKLEQVLLAFRKHQEVVTPYLPPLNSGLRGEVEDFVLGLPSDLSKADRVKYGVTALAQQETLLLEAQINVLIAEIKGVCQHLFAILHYKDKNFSTKSLRTRVGKSIATVAASRDEVIAAYNRCRSALIRLEYIDEENTTYPHLMPSNTVKKSVNERRRLGDSKRADGQLWTLGGASKRLAEIQIGEDLTVGVGGDPNTVQLRTCTRLTQRKIRAFRVIHVLLNSLTSCAKAQRSVVRKSRTTRNKKLKRKPAKGKDPVEPSKPTNAQEAREAKCDKKFSNKSDGVLWTMGRNSVTDGKALREWEEEEDFEMKHAVLHRVIRTFQYRAHAWREVSKDATLIQREDFPFLADFETAEREKFTLAAWAKRQAAINEDLSDLAIEHLKEVGHPNFVDLDCDIAEQVTNFRNNQLEWMKDLNVQRADLMFGAFKAGMLAKPYCSS
ncbi:hypothetical protein V5O48_003630 [Marasmius crinis-equi]|uniref:CxC2-like cysteine cluster KDZ transposase-associated domain-containing protein n=1 Tax=Marasmius crinis-equi TaxID=585013 RepID=A0ABR3FSQ4_9AGAR